MGKGHSDIPVFKSYNKNQQTLIPLNVDDMIDKHHIVRLLSDIIDKIDIEEIKKNYKGGGASAYPPEIMLKILIYGYLNNIYSSRKLEAACNEQTPFIWLANGYRPNFRTINMFRSKRLANSIDTIFSNVVKLLHNSGVISFDVVYTDGSKLEASANRYKIVWRKNVERYKGNLEKKIQNILDQIHQIVDDDSLASIPNADSINSQELLETINSINTSLEQMEVSKPESSKNIKKAKTKLRHLENHELPKLFSYEQSEELLGERNSYSKTDPEATGLRMKDESLRAGYNVELSSTEQYVVNYSIHQEASDSVTYVPHMEKFYKMYKSHPSINSADGAYGTLENYEYAEQNNIEKHMKHGTYYQEQKAKYKHNISKNSNYYYNSKDDYIVCPMGQHMHCIGKNQPRQTKNGFAYTVDQYQAKNCQGCSMRCSCHKQEGNKIIERNNRLELFKDEVRSNLGSEEGVKIRKQRSHDVETVFGDIKENHKFRRFHLRGMAKVNIELGLLCLAHNLKKLHIQISSSRGVFFVCFYPNKAIVIYFYLNNCLIIYFFENF
jgi:transposase